MERERRQHPRYAVKMPVTVTYGREVVTALVKDISRQAVFVEARRAFPLGTEIHVTFGLPGKDGPLKVAGRVVRVAESQGDGGPGMAILFNELSPEEKVRLEFFIALQGGTPE